MIATYPDLAERAIPPNPYRGLFPFREQDAPYFFGREEFSERLLAEVERHPLTAVIGASGCGKSSVVYAGLLPRLRERPGWAIATLRPGREPFAELAAALLPLLEPQMSETDRLREVEKLATALDGGEIPLDRLARRILEKQGQERLLVVVDQFEEVYNLCVAPEMRRAFLDRWLEALAEERTPLRLVLTLRADFMGQALAYRPLADRLDGRTLLLGPMSREELERAVVRPAEAHGVVFEQGLESRLLDDVGEEPGNLPLLEFALEQLWMRQEGGRLTHRAYEEIGGVDGALVRHAEEVYAALDEAEKKAARQVLVQLAQPGEGTEDTRRRATREELGEERWEAARKLADGRLVVTGRDAAGRETAEVAHEALIRRWERLRDWMEEDRDFRLWQERTRALCRQWEEAGRDESALLGGTLLLQAQKWLEERGDEVEEGLRKFVWAGAARAEAERQARERRQRRLLLISAGAAVLFLLIALLAGWRWRRAEEARTEALARQLAAVGQAEFDRMAQGPFIGTALGVTSMCLRPSWVASQLLRRGLELLPRPVAWMNHDWVVSSVAFSPDGHHVVSGSLDSTVRVWEAATGKEVARMTHEDYVTSAVFSPDGRYVASGSDYGTVRVWEVATGKEVARMPHGDGVTSVAFSPDGRYVVSGSNDGTARVWEAATGKEVARMTHKSWVSSVAFSPDGRYVVSGSWDGTAQVWASRSENPIETACRHLPRNLTWYEWQRYAGPEAAYEPACPNLPIPEDTLQILQTRQYVQEQQAVFFGIEGVLFSLTLILFLSAWRRKGRPLLVDLALLLFLTALTAGWQAWNAWRGPTSLPADAAFVTLALLGVAWVSFRRPWIKLRVLAWVWLLLAGYALGIYVLSTAGGVIPALPGAEAVVQGWYFLQMPMFTLRSSVPSWPTFATFWLYWLGLAFLLLLTGYSLGQAAGDVWRFIRRLRARRRR